MKKVLLSFLLLYSVSTFSQKGQFDILGHLGFTMVDAKPNLDLGICLYQNNAMIIHGKVLYRIGEAYNLPTGYPRSEFKEVRFLPMVFFGRSIANKYISLVVSGGVHMGYYDGYTNYNRSVLGRYSARSDYYGLYGLNLQSEILFKLDENLRIYASLIYLDNQRKSSLLYSLGLQVFLFNTSY